MAIDRLKYIRFKVVSRFLINALMVSGSLLIVGCYDLDLKTNFTEEEEAIDLNEVYASYSEKGGPLAEIDFNQPLNPEWVKKDLLVLKQILEEANPNIYRYTSKKDMDLLFEQASAEANDSLSYLDFVRQIARIFNRMACGHSGWMHTSSYRSYRDSSIRLFPLKIVSNKERYYVLQNYSLDGSIQEGAEILSINGQRVTNINSILRKHMYRDGTSIPKTDQEISDYFPNAYSNFIANPDVFKIRLKENGSIRSISLTPLKKETIDSISKINYSSKSSVNEPLLSYRKDSNGTGIYSIQSFRNERIEAQGQNFVSFTEAVFQDLSEHRIRKLLIDLRANTGGWTANGKKLFSYFIKDTMSYVNKVELSRVDSFSFQSLVLSDQGLVDTMKFEKLNDVYQWTNYPSLEVYPELDHPFNGKVIILIDENSRSCSGMFASMMRNHTEAIFMGEENGSAQCGQGGMLIVAQLPYTGLMVRTSTAKYSLNVENPGLSRGVVPEISLEPNLENLLNEQDPLLDLALKQLETETK